MSDMNLSFSGSTLEFYDRFLPFALNLAERLRGMTSGQVREVAAEQA
jgi:hypothetical protein